jgi:adenosylhomocysteine nucleosidase
MATTTNHYCHVVMALQEESKGKIETCGYPVHYTGIGLISAAQKTTEIILKYQPKIILNLGSAGSFDLPVGSLVEVTTVCLRQRSLPFISKPIAVAAFTDLSKVYCGSADFVETKKQQDDQAYNIMDMEAYAIAKVAQMYGTQFHCVKYITDQSNQNTFQDWKKNLETATILLQQTLKQYTL